MLRVLTSSAPTVDPNIVILSGASEIRSRFTPLQVSGVVVTYMRGLKVAFAFAIATTGLALVVSVFGSWKRLHTGPTPGAESENVVEAGYYREDGRKESGSCLISFWAVVPYGEREIHWHNRLDVAGAIKIQNKNKIWEVVSASL